MTEYMQDFAAGAITDYESETKPLSQGVDLIIWDCEADGVIIDCQNNSDKSMHVRFDFHQSENLALQDNEHISKVDEHRCAFDIPGKSKGRYVHLEVVDLDEGSYDLKYKVEGFHRNQKGEIVNAKGEVQEDPGLKSGSESGNATAASPASPPGPASSSSSPASAEASGSASKPKGGGDSSSSSSSSSPSSATGGQTGGGGGRGAVPSQFSGDPDEVEEKKVSEHVLILLKHWEGEGYLFVAKHTSKQNVVLSLDGSQSENLEFAHIAPAESGGGDGKLTVRVDWAEGEEVPIGALTATPAAEEDGYAVAYKVSSKIDNSSSGGSTSGAIDIKKKPSGPTPEELEAEKKAKEEAEEKAKKIREEAERKAKEEAEAKKAAEEEKKKKAEEAAVEGEARKKREAEEKAAKDAEEKAKRKEEAEIRGEAAKKKKQEEEQKKKEAEEAREKARRDMMEKAHKQAEAAKAADEKKKKEQEEFEAERKKVAEKHAEKEAELYGELEKKKLTPYEEKEIAAAKAASDKEGEQFANDCAQKSLALATPDMKDKLGKLYGWMALIRRRYEIEWRLRFLLIERQFWEKVCALCRDFISGEVKMHKHAGREHRLHPECYDKAPKCDVCSGVLVGAYTQTKAENPVRLHNECLAKYKESNRPKCQKCDKKITNSDKWVTKGEQHWHNECA